MKEKIEEIIEQYIKKASLENSSGTIISMDRIRIFIKKINKDNYCYYCSDDLAEYCQSDNGYLCDNYDLYYIMSLIKDEIKK